MERVAEEAESGKRARLLWQRIAHRSQTRRKPRLQANGNLETSRDRGAHATSCQRRKELPTQAAEGHLERCVTRNVWPDQEPLPCRHQTTLLTPGTHWHGTRMDELVWRTNVRTTRSGTRRTWCLHSAKTQPRDVGWRTSGARTRGVAELVITRFRFGARAPGACHALWTAFPGRRPSDIPAQGTALGLQKGKAKP
jgi:hypothetical protein